MKAIIEGRKYNTETATKLGNYRWGAYGDFNHIDESLYRTKKGRYFLAGEGGAMTHYSRSCGDNSWCGGEKNHSGRGMGGPRMDGKPLRSGRVHSRVR